MKKLFVTICAAVTALFALALVACSTPLEPLATPANLRVEYQRLIWDRVRWTTEYTVRVDDESEFVTTETNYDISSLGAGTHKLQVKAMGGENYSDSEWASLEYNVETVAEGYDETGFKYTLLEDGSGYELSLGKLIYNDEKLTGEVKLRDRFCGLPVKTIGEWMFNNSFLSLKDRDVRTGKGCNTLMTSVILPSELEYINGYAFAFCISLKTVEFPKSLKRIGTGAFLYATSLEKAVLPEGITDVYTLMFGFCYNLKEVVLPDSLENVYPQAFSGCNSLTTINAPSNVLIVDDYAFRDCSSLMDIPVFENIEYLGEKVFAGTKWYNSQSGFLTYRDDILCDYNGAIQDGKLIIPPIYKYSAALVFRGRNDITYVEFQSPITVFGGGMFSNCVNIKKVVLADGMKEIADYMFYQCSSMEEVRMPDSIERIGRYSFYECKNLKSIVIPAKVKSVETHAFWTMSTIMEWCLLMSHDAKFSGYWTLSRRLYFYGTKEEYEALCNAQDPGVTIEYEEYVYYYSATEPQDEGQYWRFVDDKPIVW